MTNQQFLQMSLCICSLSDFLINRTSRQLAEYILYREKQFSGTQMQLGTKCCFRIKTHGRLHVPYLPVGSNARAMVFTCPTSTRDGRSITQGNGKRKASSCLLMYCRQLQRFARRITSSACIPNLHNAVPPQLVYQRLYTAAYVWLLSCVICVHQQLVK